MRKLLAFASLPVLILLVCSWSVSPVFGQTTLLADGVTNTYTLIDNAFSTPGGSIAYEVPDCSHPAFGPHITQSLDNTLNKYVFNFFIHVTPDNDRCIAFDRQRNEVKTWLDSLVALQGDTLEQRWKFQLPSGFQPSPDFTHIHQVKPIDGNADLPIITLTPRYGTPNMLQLGHYDDGDAFTLLAQTPLAPFLGTWVEADEVALYDFSGTYSITIRRVSDGAVLFSYTTSNIEMWRSDTTRVRGKWGIYRSLLSSGYLRDEDVLYRGICVAKAPATCPSIQ